MLEDKLWVDSLRTLTVGSFDCYLIGVCAGGTKNWESCRYWIWLELFFEPMLDASLLLLALIDDSVRWYGDKLIAETSNFDFPIFDLALIMYYWL